jgi:V/A-type H+-transporting ATPase subunit I
MHLSVVILERDEHAVLHGLGQFGAVQLTRTHCGPDTAPLTPRDRAEEVACCARIRTRVEELRRSLAIQPGRRSAHAVKLTLHEAEEALRLMEEKAAEPLQRRAALLERQRELAEVAQQTSGYRGLDIPLDHQDRFSFLHFVTGSLPAQNFDSLRTQLGENVILFPLDVEKDRRSLLALTTGGGRPGLDSALERAGFQHAALPTAAGLTVDALFAQAEQERRETADELEEVNNRLAAYAAEFRGPLSEIDELADTEYRLLEAEQKFPRTEAAVLITGWVPAHAAAPLEQRLAAITHGRYAFKATFPDGTHDEQIPVLLRHSWLLRPFETLVATYGLPSYRELEPTLFVAISYILMFGLMFGDVGHGLVFVLGGLFMLMRAPARAKDFGLLLLFAGSSSMIFGAIYGSYFGIGLFKHYALWHDPLEGDPIRLMYLTIGFGIVMISLGLVLNVINRFRRGDVIGGFLDKFGIAGLLFYWGALALLTQTAFFTSRGLLGLSIALFLGIPLVGWAAKEPIEYLLARRAGEKSEAHEGMTAAITESFVGAFEGVLSYLANTISFVRLAAYAMSHAALLVAAFMLAAQVKDFQIGGSVWSIVVIILGNLIAIILEGIIASVQALRLEYYEFFGKFFSGSGQPFEPFRLAEGGEIQPS